MSLAYYEPTRPREAQRSPESDYVCWTKMQAEAGQPLDQIVLRKEIERAASDGVFFWGVGNAPALIASVLARTEIPVPVVFSIMKSRPKLTDVCPRRVWAWRRYIDANGVERPLPPAVLVTSRGDSETPPRRGHFALICRSEDKLDLAHNARPFDPSAFRNAGGTGAPVGASQVTSLLRRVEDDAATTDYKINLSASLAGSYWVKLTDPVELRRGSLEALANLSAFDEGRWRSLVDRIRSRHTSPERDCAGSLL